MTAAATRISLKDSWHRHVSLSFRAARRKICVIFIVEKVKPDSNDNILFLPGVTPWVIYVRYTRLWRIHHWILWISFFVTEFSARFVALLGESHFFSLNSVTFLTLIFCSYNFALNSVNFLAPTWSLKKTFCSSPLYSKFPPTDFGEMNNSSLILVTKKRPMIYPKLKNPSSYWAKNLLVLQCNGFENERHQQCMFKCGPSCPSSG